MPETAVLEQAVILAGGLGTRLGSLTANKPKSLVDIKGKPFMQYQLEMMAGRGISSVLILTGLFGEQIEAAFGSGKKLGISLTYSREPEPMGTGGALVLAKELLPPVFFLVYGDSYLDFDYQSAAGLFFKSRLKGPAGLMVAFPAGKGNDDAGNVRLDSTGMRVESYKKGQGGLYNYLDAGMSILTSDVADWLPSHQASALEEYVYPKLAAEGRMLAFISPGRFYDIGTPQRLVAFTDTLPGT